MKTLIMSGSMRSSQKNLDKIESMSRRVSTVAEYSTLVEKELANGANYCNSDVLTGIALLAMQEAEVNPVPFSLATIFQKSDSCGVEDEYNNDIEILEEKYDELYALIHESYGLLLISPVYFGDRSSVANKFLQMASKSSLFANKVFGCAAVGAKRNGGQETTVIYCLLEALKHGALIVGNGPPTAQYGGTAVGGHRGTVIKDVWGLTTTYGVAKRVTQIAKLHEEGIKGDLKDRLRVLILVTMDNGKRDLLRLIESYVKDIQKEDDSLEFVVFDTLQHTFYRCVGCKNCPADGVVSNNKTLSLQTHARCIIKKEDDGIHEVQKELIQADAVLIAGFNGKDASDITYRYQVLVERTRYIRRDNFELTNKLFGSFTLHEVGAQSNSLHFAKTVTSYIRHNVPMAKPIDVFAYNGTVLESGKKNFSSFLQQAKILHNGRNTLGIEIPQYVTTGIGGYE